GPVRNGKRVRGAVGNDRAERAGHKPPARTRSPDQRSRDEALPKAPVRLADCRLERDAERDEGRDDRERGPRLEVEVSKETRAALAPLESPDEPERALSVRRNILF